MRKASVIEYFLRLLYPVRCVCCDTLLPLRTQKEICDECEKSLPTLSRQAHSNPIGDSIGRIYAAFDYEGGIRKAIHRLKFNDKTENASVLINLSYAFLNKTLLEQKPIFSKAAKYDIIIPVPIHSGRKRQRGYNQSELLASCLAKQIKRPVSTHALIKKKNTPPQSALGRRERFKNLTGAFQVQNAEAVRESRILLVDDVMTTGSTLEQCGKVLLEAGATQVDAFVIAVRRKSRADK